MRGQRGRAQGGGRRERAPLGAAAIRPVTPARGQPLGRSILAIARRDPLIPSGASALAWPIQGDWRARVARKGVAAPDHGLARAMALPTLRAITTAGSGTRRARGLPMPSPAITSRRARRPWVADVGDGGPSRRQWHPRRLAGLQDGCHAHTAGRAHRDQPAPAVLGQELGEIGDDACPRCRKGMTEGQT